jgi:hypothetical protein
MPMFQRAGITGFKMASPQRWNTRFQLSYEMKLKTSKFKFLEFWSQLSHLNANHLNHKLFISFKHWNAGGSGKPPSLIPDLWNIGILIHKQATLSKHFESECMNLAEFGMSWQNKGIFSEDFFFVNGCIGKWNQYEMSHHTWVNIYNGSLQLLQPPQLRSHHFRRSSWRLWLWSWGIFRRWRCPWVWPITSWGKQG